MSTTKVVEIETAQVDGVKADLVKREVRVTIVVPLSELTQSAQEDLAFMSFMEVPCRVEFEQKQRQMEFGGSNVAGKILDKVAEEINKQPDMSATVSHSD